MTSSTNANANQTPPRSATFPFTLSTLNSFNLFNLFNLFNPMNRLALLLPILALAAAPARAEDPATRSPVAGKSHAVSAEGAG